MALEEHSFEAPAIGRCLNFLGIAMRDGRHHIGVDDTCFHPVHIAPKLQAARVEEIVAVQSCFLQDGGIPASLVLQIMDSIDDTGRPPAQEIAMGGTQIGNAGSCLPVVEMNDIGNKV